MHNVPFGKRILLCFCCALCLLVSCLHLSELNYSFVQETLLAYNYNFFTIFLVLIGRTRLMPRQCLQLPPFALWTNFAGSSSLIWPVVMALWAKWPGNMIKFKTSLSFIMTWICNCCAIGVYGSLALYDYHAVYEVHLAPQGVTERLSCENHTHHNNTVDAKLFISTALFCLKVIELAYQLLQSWLIHFGLHVV